MQVPDDIRRCVVFLGYLDQQSGDYVTVGTAFLFGRPTSTKTVNPTIFVTAAHVIRELSKRLVDTMYVRINRISGSAMWIPLAVKEWKFHPNRREVDVAMVSAAVLQEGIRTIQNKTVFLDVPLPVESVFGDHVSIPENFMISRSVIEEEEIGVGDEVLVTGLFQPHSGKDRNIPIVRVGNLASMDEEPVTTRVGRFPAYLIEARSIGGLSGSPVFVSIGTLRRRGNEIGPPLKEAFYLIGLIQGHFDIREANVDRAMPESEREAHVNMGIAIVVPWFEIVEVWKQPCFQDLEEQVDREFHLAQLKNLHLGEIGKTTATTAQGSTLDLNADFYFLTPREDLTFQSPFRICQDNDNQPDWNLAKQAASVTVQEDAEQN